MSPCPQPDDQAISPPQRLLRSVWSVFLIHGKGVQNSPQCHINLSKCSFSALLESTWAAQEGANWSEVSLLCTLVWQWGTLYMDEKRMERNTQEAIKFPWSEMLGSENSRSTAVQDRRCWTLIYRRYREFLVHWGSFPRGYVCPQSDSVSSMLSQCKPQYYNFLNVYSYCTPHGSTMSQKKYLMHQTLWCHLWVGHSLCLFKLHFMELLKRFPSREEKSSDLLPQFMNSPSFLFSSSVCRPAARAGIVSLGSAGLLE